MTPSAIPKLKIQEVVLPYGGAGPKGRLFAATLELSKPRTVTADQWCQQVLEAAEASGFKYLVVPWSFWPEGCPPDSVRLGQRYVQVMDTVAGIELLCGETPEQGLREVNRLLRGGQDLLVVSASQNVPGFIPAALAQMNESGIHIVKLWHPTVVSLGYELTPFQVGYLAGQAIFLRSSCAR